MGFLREMFQRAGLDCTGYFLVGIGVLLIAAQIAVHRTRNLYVGIMGLALVITAMRRALDLPEPWGWILLSAQVLAFGYVGVLMFLHSWDNVRAVRRGRREREQRLLAELQEIARQAQEGRQTEVPAAPEANGHSPGEEAASTSREEPT